MGALTSLIVPLLVAVGDVIRDAVDDDRAGNPRRARAKLEYFTLLAKEILARDRSEAEAILLQRFPDEDGG